MGQLEEKPVRSHAGRFAADELPPGLSDLVQILDNLPGLVTFWDHEARNRYANAAFLRFFGLEAETLVGRHVSEVLGPELYARNHGYIEAALAGEPQTFERRMTDSTGEERYVQSSYVPNTVDGLPAGFFVLSSDITDRVRTEQALQDSVRQLALLEERQRIAADLHDLVIQRLFAAGLDLAAAGRQGPGSEEAWSRVMTAAEGVDEAIRELRRSIHSLRELTYPGHAPERIDRILVNAARILGFQPSYISTGSLDDTPPEVVEELLAVLNESLSNVAKHAQASSVQVTLAVSDGQVLLRVADDGRGMQGSSRSSGLANMRRRAERFGGTFTWRDNLPTGTVVDWSVPLG
ncbi:PAS domain-containing protein [Nocardioides caldifontis]|uniref:sensor histidine kinase n=1 Tax=Nocardioides caldifontis TaxID=2588938 RepID=UPI0011DF308F|nr:PAS domain-containing protein [Nocardioides caldifontis]